MLAENVVELYKSELYEEIQSYLYGEIQNKNTRTSYNRDIRQFFKTVLRKDIEHITIEEIKTIKKKDILNYRKHLTDNFELANSTINNKISSVRSLYLYLSADYSVNTSIFNIKGLKVHHESYGSLSQTEAERFAETAWKTEREKPFQKKLMILFATRTSFRLNEVLNVRWRDFEKYCDGVYKVTTFVGKGDKHNTTAISENLYKEICKLKEENKLTKWKGDPELVFQISVSAIGDMMDRVKIKLGIGEDRRIVFHSFRGVAIDYILEAEGDITKAAIHANHSNPMTTYKHYVNKTKDWSKTPGVMMELGVDMSFLDNVTLEQFRDFFIKSSDKLKLDLKVFTQSRR